MLVHNVYFYLKPDLGEGHIAAFEASLEGLAEIEETRQVYVGRPVALAPEPMGQSGFTVALTVIFDSVADHDAYQKHPLHVAFLEENKASWDKVEIYDAESK